MKKILLALKNIPLKPLNYFMRLSLEMTNSPTLYSLIMFVFTLDIFVEFLKADSVGERWITGVFSALFALCTVLGAVDSHKKYKGLTF